MDSGTPNLLLGLGGESEAAGQGQGLVPEGDSTSRSGGGGGPLLPTHTQMRRLSARSSRARASLAAFLAAALESGLARAVRKHLREYRPGSAFSVAADRLQLIRSINLGGIFLNTHKGDKLGGLWMIDRNGSA